MQVQLQSATAKLPQRHHAGIMEIPGIVGDIGTSLVQYPEFVRDALGWGRILAVRCTACDHSCSWQGSWRYSRTWYLTNKFIWFYVILDAKLTSLTMSTFSTVTSLKELWLGVLQGVVKTGLAIAIPEDQKAWTNMNAQIWACQRSLEMNNMICPYFPTSGTFILFNHDSLAALWGLLRSCRSCLQTCRRANEALAYSDLYWFMILHDLCVWVGTTESCLNN